MITRLSSHFQGNHIHSEFRWETVVMKMCIPVDFVEQQVRTSRMRSWQLGTVKSVEHQSDGETENDSFLSSFCWSFSASDLHSLSTREIVTVLHILPFSLSVRLRIHESSDKKCRYDLILIDHKRCYSIFFLSHFKTLNITAFTCSRSPFCRLSTQIK